MKNPTQDELRKSNIKSHVDELIDERGLQGAIEFVNLIVSPKYEYSQLLFEELESRE